MSSEPKVRRKIIVINRAFQFRMAFYICSWLIALSFVYPWIIYNLFEFFVRYAVMDPMGPELVGLYKTRHEVIVLLLATQAALLFLTSLVSLFLGHRIAGPLYKLKRYFAQVTEGDLSGKLSFREKDHFHDVADSYNEMISTIREKVQRAATQIEQAAKKASPEVRAELESALQTLPKTTSTP